MRTYSVENIDRVLTEARSGSADDRFRLLVLGSGMSRAIPEEAYRIRLPLSGSVTAGHPMTGGVAILAGGTTVVLAGREHIYESDASERERGLLDFFLEEKPSRLLFLSAAGGVSPRLRTGDLMLHADYLSPIPVRRPYGVVRKQRERGGAVRISDQGVGRLFERATEAGVRLHTGVYAWVSGPSYETRAEIRMLRRAGADAVGMSAYPEIVAAERHGIPAIGVSLITNELSDVERFPLDHSEVTAASSVGADRVRRLVACW